MYKPQGPFSTPLTLMVPSKVTVKGSTKKTYADSGVFFCSFKTFGGTETVVNDVLTVVDTAVIEMWFDPTIKADCRVRTENGEEYDILGTPEDIEQRHMYLRFKCKAVKGGA